MLNGRNLSDSNVTEVNSTNGVPLRIYTDRAPKYYTVTQDKFIICDSYDAAVDTTLHGSKTVAAGREQPVFTVSDSFIPQLDANLFPFLLAEAKAVAFATVLKQQANSKLETISREHKIRQQNQRHRFKGKNRKTVHDHGADYGRKGRGFGVFSGEKTSAPN